MSTGILRRFHEEFRTDYLVKYLKKKIWDACRNLGVSFGRNNDKNYLGNPQRNCMNLWISNK